MSKININRILVLGIVLLLVTNISTIVGIVWHLKNDEFAKPAQQEESDDVDNMPRGQFFNHKLNLDQEQTYIFRDLFHQYKIDAGKISGLMDKHRKEMIDELISENPDSLALDRISGNIGVLHKQLKELTINYFLDMKRNCDPEQEQKLHDIFNSLLNEQADVRMPNRQGLRGFGRKWKEKHENKTPDNQ